MAAAKAQPAVLDVCGHELKVSNPDKPFFPQVGLTKIDLVNYYVAGEQAVVRGLRERPTVLKRWVDGVAGDPFFQQKRVPEGAPEWLQTATATCPAGVTRAARAQLTPRISCGG